MAAATSDRKLSVIRATDHAIKLNKLGKDSTAYYIGTLLTIDSSGDVVNATDAANTQIWGVCTRGFTAQSTAASPTDDVTALRGVIVNLVNDTNLTADDEGKNCFVLDNQTVTNAATVTNDVKVGYIHKFVSTTVVQVMVGVFAAVDA